MDVVRQQVSAYQSAPFDDRGEASGKIAALEVLEEHLHDPCVLDFFLRVVADPNEYDLARLHLLKLFEVNPVPAARRRIGECVAAALPGEEDWTVRCWLARAVARYTDVATAFAVALDRVADPTEDEDVRHNCLSGLRGRGSEPEVRRILRKLAAEKGSLAGAARDELARISEDDRPL